MSTQKSAKDNTAADSPVQPFRAGESLDPRTSFTIQYKSNGHITNRRW
jgi:hypothetical protein